MGQWVIDQMGHPFWMGQIPSNATDCSTYEYVHVRRYFCRILNTSFVTHQWQWGHCHWPTDPWQNTPITHCLFMYDDKMSMSLCTVYLCLQLLLICSLIYTYLAVPEGQWVMDLDHGCDGSQKMTNCQLWHGMYSIFGKNIRAHVHSHMYCSQWRWRVFESGG